MLSDRIPRIAGAACFLVLSMATFTCQGADKPGESVGSGPTHRAETEIRTYEVIIPEAWRGMLSVGKLSFVGRPFYGVPWELGVAPVVRVNLPLRNLTGKPLYVWLSYRAEARQRGRRNTEMGAYYALEGGEERLVDTIVPIGSTTRPYRFLLRMGEPHAGPPRREPWAAGYEVVVTIDPLPVSEPRDPAGNVEVTEGTAEHFAVKDVQLAHSEKEGGLLRAEVLNRTSRDLPLGIYVAVNDPHHTERGGGPGQFGFFSESVTIVRAKAEATISVPYTSPSHAPEPLLAFTLFEPREEYATYGESDPRKGDARPVCWGSVDLRQAADRGDAVIPAFVPVEERIKLTAETKSEHFVFHYRPGSYAEQELPNIIRERERAYDRLSAALNMELPRRVRIDLYPDMKAKGVGSGTKITPANTVSSFHIAEVYDQIYQCDPHHELAHLFAYQLPDHPALGDTYRIPGSGLMEGFAEYFERGGPRLVEHVCKKTQEGRSLPALSELLISSEPIGSPEHSALVHFLVRKDVEKFKRFYVTVVGNATVEGAEHAAEAVYGKSLGALAEEWHGYLKSLPATFLTDVWIERLRPTTRRRTTEHFDIYYAKGSTAEREVDHICHQREKGYQQICEFLGRDPEVRILLLFFEDQQIKLRETGHQGLGWAFGTTVVEVYNDTEQLDPYHETAHVLMRGRGSPPALFNEGFAVYMSERLGAPPLKNLGGGPLSLYERVAGLKAAGDWIPLEELLTYTDIGPGWSRPPVSYAEAGAFVKFLVETHGKDRFLQAYAKLRNSGDEAVHKQNQEELERIYGQSLEELREAWFRAAELDVGD